MGSRASDDVGTGRVRGLGPDHPDQGKPCSPRSPRSARLALPTCRGGGSGRRAEQVAAAVRLAEGRRRGAAKFARAGLMWFDPTGLEQATAEAVSRHKATRFAGRTVVDLCCGVGGDALALGAVADVLAVDRDMTTGCAAGPSGMPRFTRPPTASRPSGRAPRRSRFPAGPGSISTPTVESGPRRARDLAGCLSAGARLPPESPGPSRPGGAIKLGPASDFDDHFGADRFEVELVSLGGECKEASVWFGAALTCRRRATSLPSRCDLDRPGRAVRSRAPGGRPGGDWVFDPDPALTRAGLARRLRHGARPDPVRPRGRLPDRGRSHPVAVPVSLRGDRRPAARPQTAQARGRRGLGTLEVKTRGVDLRPEDVRARLRPTGGEPAVVLAGRGPTSLWSSRLARDGPGPSPS